MPGKCSQCGVTLPAGRLDGLCPACLLKQGVDTSPTIDAVPFQPPPLEEIQRLFPQLEILAFIGKGGMGAVYKARQPALDRLVALKILSPHAAGASGFAERFNREARALARLNHPNIVAVHEFGQTGALPYLIMEFVDGLTLRQLERSARLAPAEALRIVPQICDALQYAHDEGIVHRDIKPENILIDKKGRVKIADFGIAKIIGGPGVEAPVTATRQVIGTPHYMAPEQVETPQSVDHRADIFSLGVVFYEMLTGQLPLGKFAPPSRKVEIDARLDEVVLRALEREPELRFQRAGEVKTELDTIASSKEIVRPALAPVPAPGEQRIFAWLALSLMLCAILGSPLLFTAFDEAALMFGILALLLALIFGIISWREKMGKVVVWMIGSMITISLVIFLIIATVIAPRNEHRAEAEQKALMAQIEAAQKAAVAQNTYLKDARRLQELRNEINELKALHTTNNPDIPFMQKQIADILAEMKRMRETNGLSHLAQVDAALNAAQKSAAAKKTYNDDVVRLSGLRLQLERSKSMYTTNSPNNLSLQEQIDILTAEMMRLRNANPDVWFGDPP